MGLSFYPEHRTQGLANEAYEEKNSAEKERERPQEWHLSRAPRDRSRP